MTKYTKKTLANGLRIITVPMKNSPTVSVMTFVEAGSHDETEKQNGLSHFLEHMFFKGTKTRAPKDISEELDSVGAISNAFTSEECTAYWAKAHYKQFPKLLEVISDMYVNATLPKEELEKERGVIIEEINMYEDLPQQNVFSVLDQVMFGDQPAGRRILGPKENIRKFERKDFVSYRNTHYVAEKTIVVVAGRIDEKQVQKEVAQAFKDIPVKKKSSRKKVIVKKNGPSVHIEPKKTDQAHFLLGFHAYEEKSDKQPTLEVLSAVLGGGMSSRLFKKMREELGMCYYVRAINDGATDHGRFIIASGVNKGRFDEAISAVAGLLKELKENPVEEKELSKAKEYLLGTKAISIESSDELALFYTFQEILTGEMCDYADQAKEIKAVTAEDIKKVAQELFTADNANLAVVGNVGTFKKKVQKNLAESLS